MGFHWRSSGLIGVLEGLGTFQWVLRGIRGIPKRFSCIPGDFKALQRLQRFSMGFQWPSRLSGDFGGVSGTKRILGVSGAFQKISKVFKGS